MGTYCSPGVSSLQSSVWREARLRQEDRGPRGPLPCPPASLLQSAPDLSHEDSGSRVRSPEKQKKTESTLRESTVQREDYSTLGLFGFFSLKGLGIEPRPLTLSHVPN